MSTPSIDNIPNLIYHQPDTVNFCYSAVKNTHLADIL